MATNVDPKNERKPLVSDTAETHHSRGLDIRLPDIATAAVLLTRLPVPRGWSDFDRIAKSPWAYPLVGAGIGLLAGLVLWALIGLGVPSGPAAGLALAVMILTTGALHEDGFADCADGLGGGTTRERALEIMRDSRIGAYGTVALGLNLLIRWSSLALIAHQAPVTALIVAGAVSRAPMTVALALLRHARSDGLAASTGRPPMAHAGLALGIAQIVSLVALGWTGLVVALLAPLAALPLILLAVRRIHGITGDVLGGTQQCVDMAALILFATLLT